VLLLFLELTCSFAAGVPLPARQGLYSLHVLPAVFRLLLRFVSAAYRVYCGLFCHFHHLFWSHAEEGLSSPRNFY